MLRAGRLCSSDMYALASAITFPSGALKLMLQPVLLQVVMNVPYTAVHFATYECAKQALPLEHREHLVVQLSAGALAGAAGAACTTPLDVVKTRLQLEGINSSTAYNTTSVVGCCALCHLLHHLLPPAAWFVCYVNVLQGWPILGGLLLFWGVLRVQTLL